VSESPLHQPHDKLVKSTFSDPDNARAFLQAHLPRKLTRRIDWSTLNLASGSFIDPEFSRINHNRKGGAFEIERPKVGPKGEPSGSERVKEHREHRE
jgi:hypothetical protein